MNSPTWSDLARLLNSEAASDEWAAEAKLWMAAEHKDNDSAFAVIEMIERVGADASDVQVRIGIPRNQGDELGLLASRAKRGAVQLLIAAFAAEQSLGKLGGGT